MSEDPLDSSHTLADETIAHNTQNKRWKSAFSANANTLNQLCHDVPAVTEEEKIEELVVDAEWVPDVEWIPICPKTIDNSHCLEGNTSSIIKEDGDENEIQVLHSTIINPSISYPHQRHLCGVYPFNKDNHEQNEKFCPKCYCFICDIVASNCTVWAGQQGHCNAHAQPSGDQTEDDEEEEERDPTIVIDDSDESMHSTGAGISHGGINETIIIDDSDNSMTEWDENLTDLVQNFVTDKINQVEQIMNHVKAPQHFAYATMASRKHMNIKEILISNLKASSIPVLEPGNMEGDIPQLNLQSNFFVEGVHIGWPYPKIMMPQRQIALHLIKAFKSSKHVAIESPTGTGKSAALLCSALAWQRYQGKNQSPDHVPQPSGKSDGADPAPLSMDSQDTSTSFTKGPTRIFYCSRTHSQVKQMIATLQNTPYRPTMAVLGSRDKLCIHENLRPRDGSRAPFPTPNVNHECRIRVGNTDKYRKARVKSTDDNMYGDYDDNSPPVSLPGDGLHNAAAAEESIDENEHNDSRVQCPHYRSLTSIDMAKLAVSTFKPKKYSQSCGDKGIADNKKGVYDIEDLISFGMNPYEPNKKDYTACPYYLSQALSKDAELVFAPYNYILDPKIRRAQGINIEGAIICLDEAHNVEDTLKSAGSGDFQEMELLEMITFLSRWTRFNTGKDSGNSEGDPWIPELSHSLLSFVEKIVLFLLEKKNLFTSSPGGSTRAIEEYKKFKLPDDHEFEFISYAPIGGTKEPTGAKSFFDQLHFSERETDAVMSNLNDFEILVRANMPETQGTIFDRLSEFVTLLCESSKRAEHYYVVICMKPNGNLQFAMDEGNVIQTDSNRRRRAPVARPLIPPRSADYRDAVPHKCPMTNCISGVHGDYCDGSKPPWVFSVKVNLLNPGITFQEISSKARSVILASGSLSPIMSLCAELDLVSPHKSTPSLTNSNDKMNDKPDSSSEKKYRLQLTPKPLEASHIIDMEKQLLAFSIGVFPDGSPLTVKQTSYSQRGFLTKIGTALVKIITAVPQGGILIFLPSYSLMKKCVDAWGGFSHGSDAWTEFNGTDRDPSIWQKLVQSKGTVIVEPTESQKAFEEAREYYNERVVSTGSAILLAVYRGKMSEGISFNDNFCRAVILVGLPFPNSFDLAIKAKQKYNDEQRKFRKRMELLDGSSWYEQQAYRAVAQALGRCIRHAGDYGVIVLLDSRYCDDGSPRDYDGIARAHRNLPKWIRNHIAPFDSVGYWQGLGNRFREFFELNNKKD